MSTKLIKGTKYDTDTLTLTGWTGPHDGLSCWDYFDGDGEYPGIALGPPTGRKPKPVKTFAEYEAEAIAQGVIS
jgi:hypothetical protein